MMNVRTINPVYVNKTAVSPASRYLSFDANVTSEVTAFQIWANAKGITPKLVVDGQYGSKTKAAYKKYGAEYDQYSASTNSPKKLAGVLEEEKKPKKKINVDLNKVKDNVDKGKGIFDSLKSVFGGDKSTPVDPVYEGNVDGGSDDSKGMTTGAKVGIAIGIVAIVGVVIYVVKKKK